MSTTPVLWLGPTQVNVTDATVDGHGQTNSKVVGLSDGRILVVWEDDTRALTGFEPNDIIGRIYDAEGHPATGEFIVSTIYFDLSQQLPDIIALAGGGFAVAYQTTDAAGLGDGENITVEMFDSSGSPTRFDDYRGPLDDLTPSITLLSGNGYALISEVAGDIVGHVADGAGGEIEISIDASTDASHPDSTTLANGTFVVVYERTETGPGGDFQDVRFSLRNAAGAQITLGEVFAGIAPSVTALTGGGFVVAAETAAGVSLKVYSAAGVAVATPATITAGDPDQPIVTPLSDGGFVVGWRNDANDTINGQVYSAAGAVVGATFIVSVVGAESSPSFALLADGRIAVSFTRTDAGGDPDIVLTIWDPRDGVYSGTAAADLLTARKAGGELRGLAGADTLLGQANADILNGGQGADRMEGRAGNDTYYVDDAGDVVVEAAVAGTDRVVSTLSYTLGTNLENLSLGGGNAINGTGNALDNVIAGNAASNVLNGLAGADNMKGGAGNDTYYVDSAGDVITELAGEGTDQVRSTVTYALSANVEKLTLGGTAAINATGNDIANTLIGNAAANLLSGLAGADRMEGGLGNDIYYVDNVSDLVVEGLNAGTDQVRSTVSFTLSANVEKLTLGGTGAINAIGNAGANTLVGNSGANVISGGGGKDFLTGGAGVDRFDFNSTAESSYASYDEIMDLTDADVIDLSSIDANTALAGNQAFVLVDAFTHHAGQVMLTYSSNKDFTILAVDTDGDGVAEMRVVLHGDHDDFTNFAL